MNNAMNQMFNMNQIMRDLPQFRSQMQMQGITDPKAEVLRRLQGQAMNSPQMQKIQMAMQMMGLSF